MCFKEQLKSARSAALSTVKSAPELRPRHRDKVPLMTSEALQDSGGHQEGRSWNRSNENDVNMISMLFVIMMVICC